MQFSIKDFFIKCDKNLATMKRQMNFPNSNNFHILTLMPIWWLWYAIYNKWKIIVNPYKNNSNLFWLLKLK